MYRYDMTYGNQLMDLHYPQEWDSSLDNYSYLDYNGGNEPTETDIVEESGRADPSSRAS